MIEADRPATLGSECRQDRSGEFEPSREQAPLILTLLIDAPAQARFDRLRDLHFPPERNYLAAHITLFHHLPGPDRPAIEAALAAICAETDPFPVAIAGPRSLGRGVAIFLDAQPLARLRRQLAETWRDQLTAQDRQSFRPHVTIQNKVRPDQAKKLLGELAAGFAPFPITAEGLALWRYQGGPWYPAETWRFNPPPAPPRSPHR